MLVFESILDSIRHRSAPLALPRVKIEAKALVFANVIALFCASLHCSETGGRQGVGSVEFLIDQQISFDQLAKRRSVFRQVRVTKAQHFS